LKPGCFVKSLIFGTIVLGAIIYIISTKGEEWIITPVKEKLIASAFEALPGELGKIKDSNEKRFIVQKLDSLINLVKMDSISATISFNKLEKFMDELSKFSTDSILTKSEVEKLKKLSEGIVSTKERSIIELEKDTVK